MLDEKSGVAALTLGLRRLAGDSTLWGCLSSGERSPPTIEQNPLWLLLIGGFFAARSFFFHY
jgi:hypothetical protein